MPRSDPAFRHVGRARTQKKGALAEPHIRVFGNAASDYAPQRIVSVRAPLAAVRSKSTRRPHPKARLYAGTTLWSDQSSFALFECPPSQVASAFSLVSRGGKTTFSGLENGTHREAADTPCIVPAESRCRSCSDVPVRGVRSCTHPIRQFFDPWSLAIVSVAGFRTLSQHAVCRLPGVVLFPAVLTVARKKSSSS